MAANYRRQLGPNLGFDAELILDLSSLENFQGFNTVLSNNQFVGHPASLHPALKSCSINFIVFNQ
jgi:hypothetical protein